jgi:hypothetical protein
MSRTISFVAMYAAQVFVCAVGLIGLKRYRKLAFPLQILEWYIIYSILEDFVVDILIYKKIHTYILGQCYAIVELLLFSMIFYSWRTSRRSGFLIWLGFLIYLFIWIVGKFTFEPITGWDNYSEPVTQLIQICFGGWLLLGILKESNIVLKEDVRFWVLSGIVLYAVATFFFFGLFTPMLITDQKLLLAIWPLNDAFLVMQYVFFLRAFLCKPTRISMNLVSHNTVNS